MKTPGLSYNSRKALIVNIGETAGTEIAELMAQMAAEIEELRRTKVNVTRIVPSNSVTRDTIIKEPV
ncbi:hypothetical protein OAE40_00390 [Rubripirellula sp.]|nr:hypothetical protein [Rubripirellula sp.]MDB4654214.1 hypothetical protein [Rubripirellula sp.]